MKKLFLALVIFASIIFLNSCSEEVIKNNPVTSTTGIFVLYEGTFGQASSFDYGFIDITDDTVFSNVFSNSNNGAHLNAFPNGLQLIGSELFISSQGSFGQPGSLFKINSTNNQLITADTAFGNNPYNFAAVNGNLYVTNTGSDFVKVVDMNFSTVVNSILVGPNPADIIYEGGNVFVSKQSYTTEKSLAIINSGNQVSKIFFEGVPVSIASNSGKVYVSTYSYKKLFAVDAFTAQVVDSIDMPIAELGTGYIVSGSGSTLYVLGTDTAFQYNLGKAIYKVDAVTKTIDPGFTIQLTGTDDAYGIDYDGVENKLYVANAKGGTVNGEVRVYSTSGALVKTYTDIGGKFPRRFAFKR